MTAKGTKSTLMLTNFGTDSMPQFKEPHAIKNKHFYYYLQHQQHTQRIIIFYALIKTQLDSLKAKCASSFFTLSTTVLTYYYVNHFVGRILKQNK